jgi:carboxypeptidase C (cathepsin A)
LLEHRFNGVLQKITLDAADLVFFDPAGTGFSRTLGDTALEDYFSVSADAQQTAAFIAAWLEKNGRTASPTYILGESYGTNRAVEVARHLAEMEDPILLEGVVLFGQAVNIIEYAQRPHNIISYVVSLPTLAAIAWHHGKAETDGLDLESFINQAWSFARSSYLDALFLGNRLSEDGTREVAEQLQAFTGLSADYYIENRLRVSKEDYRVALFRDEEKIIGRADGRYVGPVKVEGAEEGAPPPDPSGTLPARLVEAFNSYLVEDLGAPSAEQYLTGSPVQGLNGWEWGGQTPFARFDYGDGMDILFGKNPEARVQIWAGVFDTMTTIGASWYLADQETWPRERVEVKAYNGGHMAYSIEDTTRQMAQDLRAFVQPR